MDATINTTGVFGLTLSRDGGIAMLPFYMAHVMGKDVFCHYTMLEKGQMSDIGVIKSKQFSHLTGLTAYRVIDIAAGENIVVTIDKAVRKAAHREALFFRWEKDAHNDSYFFTVMNPQKDRAPLFLDEIGLTVLPPFSSITYAEFKEY